jgi:hypothetical protein
VTRRLRITDGSALHATDRDERDELEAVARRSMAQARAGVVAAVPSWRRSQARFDRAAFEVAVRSAAAGRSRPILNRAATVAAPTQPAVVVASAWRSSTPPAGYVEGDLSREWLCPGCGEHRPMVGWGVGNGAQMPGVLIAKWCCPSCKLEDEPDCRSTHPRFRAALPEETSPLVRHLIIRELGKMPGAPVGIPAMPILRILEQLRAGVDALDIDVSGDDQRQRDASEVILSNVADQVAEEARSFAVALHRAWSMFVRSGDVRHGPSPERALSEAELSAVVHRERPASAPTPKES